MINQRTYPIPDDERRAYERDPMRSIDSYTRDDDFCADIRNMLIMLDEPDDAIIDDESMLSPRILDRRRTLIALRSLNREQLTEMLLSESLCPLHRIDYAICFDDDDDECAAIRMIHPSHDT